MFAPERGEVVKIFKERGIERKRGEPERGVPFERGFERFSGKKSLNMIFDDILLSLKIYFIEKILIVSWYQRL